MKDKLLIKMIESQAFTPDLLLHYLWEKYTDKEIHR
jgi:hypothetical protein